MKNLILALSATVFLFYSCKKGPKERVEKDVTVFFLLSSGNFICGEWCGTTVNVKDGEGGLKSKYELPDSILNKWEWWNREYIATIKFLDDSCHCKNGDAEPYPPGSNNFPEGDLKMVEILKIREK